MTTSRSSLEGILARSGSALDTAAAWGVLGVYLRQRALDQPTRVSDAEARVGVPAGVLEPFFREVIAAGYLTRAADQPDGVLTVTPRGRAEVDKLTAAWKAWLMDELRDWLQAHEATPEQTQQVEGGHRPDRAAPDPRGRGRSPAGCPGRNGRGRSGSCGSGSKPVAPGARRVGDWRACLSTPRTNHAPTHCAGTRRRCAGGWPW